MFSRSISKFYYFNAVFTHLVDNASIKRETKAFNEKNSVRIGSARLEALLEQRKKTFKSRFDWLDLIDTLQLERGAEVGVYKGDFSKDALTRISSLNEYILVDPWEHLADWNKPFNEKTNSEFEIIYQIAMNATKNSLAYGHKVSVLRSKSVVAAKLVEDETLDFVYIDGDHTAKGITIDLFVWVPKVKRGGLVCGDDWGGNVAHGKTFDPTMVQPVVKGYAEVINVTVYNMGGDQWGFVKP